MTELTLIIVVLTFLAYLSYSLYKITITIWVPAKANQKLLEAFATPIGKLAHPFLKWISPILLLVFLFQTFSLVVNLIAQVMKLTSS